MNELFKPSDHDILLGCVDIQLAEWRICGQGLWITEAAIWINAPPDPGRIPYFRIHCPIRKIESYKYSLLMTEKIHYATYILNRPILELERRNPVEGDILNEEKVKCDVLQWVENYLKEL